MKMRRTYGNWSAIERLRILMGVSRLKKNSITNALVTSWDMNVAQAAPCMPQPKPKMNSGSRTALAPAPISIAPIEIFGRPSERMKCESPWPVVLSAMPPSTMRA